MGSQQVYHQASIKKELREIRVLSLAPGTHNDTLQGSFEVESLDYDDIHYTAFSYTWSGPISERTIQIGQAPLKITENLAAALRQFRGPVRPKKIWVDAICINQSDDEEKGFQVALMGDIYRSASRTWVWLGEESDDSDAAIDCIVSIRDFPDF
ncbi:heterokaryon incompatibility protein-domain-containing protein, partial [Usnea florida]